ncbi:MAG: hypothetical protein OQK74_03040, partial [Gammaproteobacteria bacterium]|nr:hypothetical protein [Gammaproteobacteria bacterium]
MRLYTPKLARAVAPLHGHQHTGHGAMNPAAVLVDDELNPAVLICGLGAVAAPPLPRADIDAIVDLICRLMAVDTGTDPVHAMARALV